MIVQIYYNYILEIGKLWLAYLLLLYFEFYGKLLYKYLHIISSWFAKFKIRTIYLFIKTILKLFTITSFNIIASVHYQEYHIRTSWHDDGEMIFHVNMNCELSRKHGDASLQTLEGDTNSAGRS